MKTFKSLIIILLLWNPLFAQSNDCICKGVSKNNFKKAEHKIKKLIRKRKHGTEYDNGPGSGMQITHEYNLDTIVLLMKNLPCAADASRDKCQEKILIYPGWSVIGVKFKTSNGLKEKCFHIQEGTMGTVNIFGWHWHLFKAKNKLVYKKMYDCDGFVEEEKLKCK